MRSSSSGGISPILVFIWCLFMGVTVGSIAIGAIFPPANLLAKPFVCLNGTMRYVQATSNPRAGTTVTTTTWTCTDNKTEKSTELGIFPMSLYAGAIDGLVLWVVVLGLQVWQRRAAPGAPTQTAPAWRGPAARHTAAASRRTPHPAPDRDDAMARMKHLNELRAASLISEEEYQAKRAEILKDV